MSCKWCNIGKIHKERLDEFIADFKSNSPTRMCEGCSDGVKSNIANINS